MEVLIRVLTAAIFLLLQIVLSLSSTPPLNSTHSPLCRPTQSFALLQFKNSFAINKSPFSICGPYKFPTIDSWREDTDCCLWEGVECDESTGNVIGLHLECLYGQFPTNSSLFQLSHLQTLLLSDNNFNRSPVSSELGRLVNLKSLDISKSNFSELNRDGKVNKWQPSDFSELNVQTVEQRSLNLSRNGPSCSGLSRNKIRSPNVGLLTILAADKKGKGIRILRRLGDLLV